MGRTKETRRGLVWVLLVTASCTASVDTGDAEEGDAGNDAAIECPEDKPHFYEPWGECLECVHWQDCESGKCGGGHCL